MGEKEILKYLSELERNLNQLEMIEVKNKGDLEINVEKQWAVLHGLQLVIQNILDVGNQLLSNLKINQIESYSDIIIKLGQHNIIPENFSDKLKSIAGFRNILVHEYIAIDMGIVYAILHDNLDDIKEFVKYIRKYLRNS